MTNPNKDNRVVAVSDVRRAFVAVSGREKADIDAAMDWLNENQAPLVPDKIWLTLQRALFYCSAAADRRNHGTLKMFDEAVKSVEVQGE